MAKKGIRKSASSSTSQENRERPDQSNDTNKQEIKAKRNFLPVLMPAIIGFVGTVVAAYFGYMAIRYQTELPIFATQTAQSSSISALVNSDGNKQETSEPGKGEKPTLPPSTIASNSNIGLSTPTTKNQPEFIETRIGHDGCPVFVIPPNMGLRNSEELDLPKLAKAFSDSDQDKWDLTAGLGSPENLQKIAVVGLGVEVVNISPSTEWIRVENTVDISVTSMEVRDHVDAIMPIGCGAGGEIRWFPQSSLNNKFDKFSKAVEYPDFDFFALQPGEFELFNFMFLCEAPGSYLVNLTINYSLNNKDYKHNAQAKNRLICPKTITLWDVAGPFDDQNGEPYFEIFEPIGEYKWQGSYYIQN